MKNTYQVNGEWDNEWVDIAAHDLHEAAEEFVRTKYGHDSDVAADGSMKVLVRRPDGQLFAFHVHIDFSPEFTAKMIHGGEA